MHCGIICSNYKGCKFGQQSMHGLGMGHLWKEAPKEAPRPDMLCAVPTSWTLHDMEDGEERSWRHNAGHLTFLVELNEKEHKFPSQYAPGADSKRKKQVTRVLAMHFGMNVLSIRAKPEEFFMKNTRVDGPEGEEWDAVVKDVILAAKKALVEHKEEHNVQNDDLKQLLAARFNFYCFYSVDNFDEHAKGIRFSHIRRNQDVKEAIEKFRAHLEQSRQARQK